MPTSFPSPPEPKARSLGAVLERLRARRGLIIGFGTLAALLGLVALVLVETATIASVRVIGFFMVLAGAPGPGAACCCGRRRGSCTW